MPVEDEEDLFEAIQKVDRSSEFEQAQQNTSEQQVSAKEKVGYSSPR